MAEQKANESLYEGDYLSVLGKDFDTSVIYAPEDKATTSHDDAVMRFAIRSEA